jgi:hypothetical protein
LLLFLLPKITTEFIWVLQKFRFSCKGPRDIKILKTTGLKYARFAVLRAELLKIPFFWDVTL